MDSRKIPCVWLNMQHFQIHKCSFIVEQGEMAITGLCSCWGRERPGKSNSSGNGPPVSLEAKGNFMLQHDSREHHN